MDLVWDFSCFHYIDLIYEEILQYHFKDFKKDYDMKKKIGQSLIKHVLERKKV